jgi:hypothetical protein
MNSKIIITTLGIILFKFSFGQITTTKVINNETPKKAMVYDSTLNFLGSDALLYIGQELYLIGKSETLRTYGYSGFIIDYKVNSNSLKNTYKPIIPEDKKYIEYDMGGKSIYDSLAGKYFKVLDVHMHPKAKEQEYLYGTKFYLALEEKESGNKLFFEYDSKYEHSFPFLVVGYFEKLKQNFIGQSYVISTKYFTGSKDISTGNTIHNRPGQKWTCIDLTIEEQFFNLSLIIKNDLGEKVLADYEYLFELGGKNQVYTWKKAETYKTKFGVVNWNIILDREVKIGFTEEMVRLAWGEPKRVNKSSYGDQWVYDDQYLYFENGKLKAFN